MSDEKKICSICEKVKCNHMLEMKQDDRLEACKEIDKLKAERNSLAARVAQLEPRAALMPKLCKALIHVDYEDKMAGKAGHFLLSSDTCKMVEKAIAEVAALTAPHPEAECKEEGK